MRLLGWAKYLSVEMSRDRKTLKVTYWLCVSTEICDFRQLTFSSAVLRSCLHQGVNGRKSRFLEGLLLLRSWKATLNYKMARVPNDHQSCERWLDCRKDQNWAVRQRRMKLKVYILLSTGKPQREPWVCLLIPMSSGQIPIHYE